ncbi:unnamed protein product [Adineta steineri]|uniref:Uncharacterized protein n=1 Tax=Adineta steineri TaxID=433720 RepID=A0A814S3L0_9BILA|nr:unnamed protein product [Adineta steineri]
MARSSTKVEDYWRQHNIENLFKELTQILVRRTPSDPAIAIVEHLQKKFPKSFKTSTDNIGIVPKSLANSLQLRSTISPRSDGHNDSINDTQIGRRLSIQSQVSGIATIPTMDSAFTDVLKHNTSILSQAPESNIRTIASVNRTAQQAIKKGKDIRSDHDILEEEMIKPTKTKFDTSITENISDSSFTENIENQETHKEPTVQQIIKYKQNILTEKGRRLHQEKLAELARQQDEKEKFFRSDFAVNPEEIQQQDKLNDESTSQVVPDETNRNKVLHKPIAKSKEEEEILNDENVFQPRKQRNRGRPRNTLQTMLSTTPYIQGRHMIDPRSTMKREDGHLICKVCGNVINEGENPLLVDSKLSFAADTARSSETASVAVDDWFETGSAASSSRQTSPWKPDESIPLPFGSSTFRRNLFQPINDNHTDTKGHQSPVQSSVIDSDAAKIRRPSSSRMSESGIFARSPEVKIRRPSASRSIPSPVTKKHHSDTASGTSHELKQSSPLTTTTTTTTTNDRRMSGWSVREPSPDNTDEN